MFNRADANEPRLTELEARTTELETSLRRLPGVFTEAANHVAAQGQPLAYADLLRTVADLLAKETT